MALPPIGEQQQIVEFIDRAVEPLDVSMAKLEREIAFFREYRTRLVADVVTGKLDVREAAARLYDDVAIEIDAGSVDEAADPEVIDEEATEA